MGQPCAWRGVTLPMAPKPSVRAGVPPASDASAGSPSRGGPRSPPAILRSAKPCGHHRVENQRADEKLDVPKPSYARSELWHLGGSGGVAARGTWPDFDQAVGPPRDRRAGERVDPDREDDPGEDRPRPPRVEPGEFLRAAGCEQVEQAGEDRELGHAEDVPELHRDEGRHDGAARRRRAGEEGRELYQDRVEAASDPKHTGRYVQPLHSNTEDGVHRHPIMTGDGNADRLLRTPRRLALGDGRANRSEEHTSELQSH